MLCMDIFRVSLTAALADGGLLSGSAKTTVTLGG